MGSDFPFFSWLCNKFIFDLLVHFLVDFSSFVVYFKQG